MPYRRVRIRLRQPHLVATKAGPIFTPYRWGARVFFGKYQNIPPIRFNSRLVSGAITTVFAFSAVSSAPTFLQQDDQRAGTAVAGAGLAKGQHVAALA